MHLAAVAAASSAASVVGAMPSYPPPSQAAQVVFSDATANHAYAVEPLVAPQRRVNVTLGVMSRCPDALACEAIFDKVVDRVNPKIQLAMSYIGSIDDDAAYGVACKHGDLECLANIQQLCVQDALAPRRAGRDYDLSPSQAQRKWWSFVQCQNYAGLGQIGSEALAKRCLRLVDGPDWKRDGIEECINGKKGRKLLQHSVRASAGSGITISCTILIESETRCIRDGGSWKQCDIGHEVGDFVSHIESEWRKKNPDSARLLDAPRPNDRVAAAYPRLTRRQEASSSSSPSNPPPSDNPPPPSSGNPSVFGNSSNTPPSVFRLQLYGVRFGFGLAEERATVRQAKRQFPGSSNSDGTANLPAPFFAFAITAIALFVLVVAFVLLRIMIRNRRLRRLGLIGDDNITGLLTQTRELDDPLPPPKLWEAKIAHNYIPLPTDPDAKSKGWDAVMPVSAALPPSIYSSLFPGDATPKDGKGSAGNPTGSYPPASQVYANMISRHMHMPGFLRRGEQQEDDVAGGAAAAAASEGNDGPVGTVGDEPAKPQPEEPIQASVNVTVLIAMPSPRTVFPLAQQGRKASSGGIANAARQQQATAFPPLTRVHSTRLDEVHEQDDDADSQSHSGEAKLKRAGSVKSTRRTASGKSPAETRREAFFGTKPDRDDAGTGDAADGGTYASEAVGYDDDDDEELPELVFGTASLPIYCKGQSLATAAAAGRMPFSEGPDRYHPVRQELMQLVAAAHEARERKARNDVAAREAEAQKAGDDAQSTVVGGGVGAETSMHNRISASETIDSEPGIQLNAMQSTSHDGLGNVVGRMMAQNIDHMPARTSRPHLDGVATSSSTLDVAPMRLSVTTLDPLLDEQRNDAVNADNAAVAADAAPASASTSTTAAAK
ncbi:hypothetical protein ACQY0O_002799 [Thecaphora frezii]